MPQSDERLRVAAKIAGEAIMASYSADAEPDHCFSPEFEQKMDLLIQQTKKKPRYTLLQKVASIILAIAIGSGIWLAIDTDAHAAVFGWIREQYENIFHYHFAGDKNTTSEQSYELGWLPEGYSFHHRRDMTGRADVIYVNESGNIISLTYTTDLSNTSLDIFLMDDYSVSTKVKIGSVIADLYITSNAGSSNVIAWEDSDENALFVISAVEDSDTLIKLAENVILAEK